MRAAAWLGVVGGVLVALSPQGAEAAERSYLGVGASRMEMSNGDEFDRKYVMEPTLIRSVKFSWDKKDVAGLFGDIGIDEDNRLRDLTLGLIIGDHLVHVERGRIRGDIECEDADDAFCNPRPDTFDNRYLSVNLIEYSGGIGGVSWGYGFQKYAIPRVFEYGDGTISGPQLQDDAMQVYNLGIGLYSDPVRNFLVDSDAGNGAKHQFYGATITTYGLSVAQTSDAPDLKEYGVDGETFLGAGMAGKLEAGWFSGYRGDHWSVALNIGYRVQMHMFFDPITSWNAGDPDEGEIQLGVAYLLMHGPTAQIQGSF
ncbi:hypothetical protein [Thiohalorhabdus methylotrophus]|uniref:Outer membrane beta-barrel porin/alpha-amylase n=1 Tax=Thiohalorhabdus methylotrophus TaxID=3242694 RepID=A0ABV4TR61_9GAMM